MACACKVKQQLTYLEKTYGTKNVQSKDTRIADMIKMGFRKTVNVLICIPLLPVIGLFIVGRKIFTDSPMVIDKIFRLKKKD